MRVNKWLLMFADIATPGAGMAFLYGRGGLVGTRLEAKNCSSNLYDFAIKYG